MVALIYLGLAIALGDVLCRRYYRFVSVAHRCAAAILVGTLVSIWFTYLSALVCTRTAEPLLWADLLFFIAAPAAIMWLSRKALKIEIVETGAPGKALYDWMTLGALFVAACVLLIGTLYVNKQGRIRVSGMEASDFALQSTIAQSFALGHNFPPECPYFAGEPLRYDFLFYFQAGNLESLGLNLAWSVGLLSVLGLTSMLALVMNLGELLFHSRVVGRIGAVLFFFPGSLTSFPFLRFQGTETWTQIAFVNQRHLAGSLGVLLLILIFLTDCYSQRNSQIRAIASHTTDTDATDQGQHKMASLEGFATPAKNVLGTSGRFVFSGLLLGALPLWNTSVFIAAAAVLLLLLILFPDRLQVMLLGITASVLALPQLIYLHPNPGGDLQFHWSSPPLTKIVSYVAFMFGAKWLLIALALILASRFQRRFFIGLCSLFLLAICAQLRSETLASQNFLNVWLVVANLFAAYGLCRLWKLRAPPIVGAVAALALAAPILVAGSIDLISIRKSSYAEVNYEKDDLVQWIRKNMKPEDVFLSDRFASHAILLAGRKIFLGPPTFLQNADHGAANREIIYRQMFESKNPWRVYDLLKKNNIAYVAFDDGIRHGELIKDPNENVYLTYFPKIYEDKENRYRKLTIYKIPETAPANLANMDLSGPTMNAFQGGKGRGKGQFDNPHGLALDTTGNIFVADTDNGRIEKFSPNGTFLESIEQIEEPNGIAIDRGGSIYVAEMGAKHRVRKLGADGTFIAQWAPGLYGPRKIAIGPDDSIYVVDSGRNRIVKLNSDGQLLTTWGSEGSADGQVKGISSVAIDPTNNKVYVADPLNCRIQVFDTNGKFLSKWPIPEWGQPLGYEDLAVDSQRGRLYASSAHMHSILVFDLQGNKLGTLSPTPPNKLEGPSAIALANDKLFVLNTASARVSVIGLQNR